MSNKEKKIKLQLWQVDWKDAKADGGWQTIFKIKPYKLLVVHSTGYAVYEDKEVLVLAQQLSSSGNFADTITIPKSCIVKRRKLKHIIIYE